MTQVVVEQVGECDDLTWPSGRLLVGDCRDLLAGLPEQSIDACITDPPYDLTGSSRGGSSRNPGTECFGRIELGGDRGFMGQTWDGTGVAFDSETWQAVYRVLKPGGHLLVFGGTRTYHKMASAVEAAGFEVRDIIGWCYAQGLPKSLDVAGEIDRSSGASPEQWAQWLRLRREELGMTRAELAAKVPCTVSSVRDWEEGRAREVGAPVEHVLPAPSHRRLLTEILGYPDSKRIVVEGKTDRRDDDTIYGLGHSGATYAGASSEAAAAWDGWGTALKPGWELILVARRPTEGTVAENVLKHGTGALNLGGCRIGSAAVTINTFDDGEKPFGDGAGHPYHSRTSRGRWPTNLVFSHHEDCVCVGSARVAAPSGKGGREGEPSAQRRYSEEGATDFAMTPGQRLGDEDGMETIERWACVAECPIRQLDDQAGTRTSGTVGGTGYVTEYSAAVYGQFRERSLRASVVYGDSGAASRFFPTFGASDPIARQALRFVPKAPRQERPVGIDGTKHPTVKPLDLMRWLVRLVVGEHGTCLDPFMGSGALAEAAALERRRWVGIELCDGTDDRPNYVELITQRMERFACGGSPGMPGWMRQEVAGQGSLFDLPLDAGSEP